MIKFVVVSLPAANKPKRKVTISSSVNLSPSYSARIKSEIISSVK